MSEMVHIIGLFLLVFRRAADFGLAAIRCATADLLSAFPNLGRKASRNNFPRR